MKFYGESPFTLFDVQRELLCPLVGAAVQLRPARAQSPVAAADYNQAGFGHDRHDQIWLAKPPVGSYTGQLSSSVKVALGSLLHWDQSLTQLL